LKASELKGRYIDCNQDIGELLERIEEVKNERLNIMKVDMYPTGIVIPSREIPKET